MISQYRAWGDASNESLKQSAIESLKQEMAANQGKPDSEVNFLALSGGGGEHVCTYQATRHSFATQKLIAGHSEAMVMEVTGHKTREAFKRYGKLACEHLTAVVEDEPRAAGKKRAPV